MPTNLQRLTDDLLVELPPSKPALRTAPTPQPSATPPPLPQSYLEEIPQAAFQVKLGVVHEPMPRRPARPALDMSAAVLGSQAWASVPLEGTPAPELEPELVFEPATEIPSRPLPEVVRRSPSVGGLPRPVSAPVVVGLDPEPQARVAPPRAPTPRPVANTHHRQIKERARTSDLPRATRDLPSVEQQKGERFFQEAIKAMRVNDYQAANRHLAMALTFSPNNARYSLVRRKVRHYLQLETDDL